MNEKSRCTDELSHPSPGAAFGVDGAAAQSSLPAGTDIEIASHD